MTHTHVFFLYKAAANLCEYVCINVLRKIYYKMLQKMFVLYCCIMTLPPKKKRKNETAKS